MRAAFFLFTLCLQGAEPFLEKSDLFEAGRDDYSVYRIPGVVVTRLGTVIAYCEARKTERGDWGTIDIYLRRSTDGGRAWSRARKTAAVEGPHRKNPAALLQKLATEGEVTYNNPVAIADMKTAAVHFLFSYEYMRAFYMRSDDDGQTFSKPVEITATFEEFRSDYPWRVIATGPNHGIQLRTGRLIVPVWLSSSTGGHAHRPSVSSVIYSDDHGKSWHRGDIAVPDTADFVFPSESAAVEPASGGVMLNVRSESKAHRRIVTYSKDGATGWSKRFFHPELLEPICMAGLARMTMKPPADRNRLLFSNPSNLERLDGNAEPGKNRDRRNLTVKLSYDEGETWAVSKPLEPGWSGYSDLAVTHDGTILCFYERGGLDENQFNTAALTMARFNLEWLTEGKDHLTGPVIIFR
jgi:Neuraminidase (sialidase)